MKIRLMRSYGTEWRSLVAEVEVELSVHHARETPQVVTWLTDGSLRTFVLNRNQPDIPSVRWYTEVFHQFTDAEMPRPEKSLRLFFNPELARETFEAPISDALEVLSEGLMFRVTYPDGRRGAIPAKNLRDHLKSGGTVEGISLSPELRKAWDLPVPR